MSKRSHRVVCGVTIVKQKRQACAAFLGVLTVSINLVSVCCILTTILRVLCPGDGMETGKTRTGDTPADALLRINLPVKIRHRSRGDSAHEKGRSRSEEH